MVILIVFRVYSKKKNAFWTFADPPTHQTKLCLAEKRLANASFFLYNSSMGNQDLSYKEFLSEGKNENIQSKQSGC